MCKLYIICQSREIENCFIAVSNIIQELEKSFQAVVVINKQLYKNLKHYIVMLEKTSILNKSTLFSP